MPTTPPLLPSLLLTLTTLLSMLPPPTSPTTHPALTPGTEITFSFPDLPPTLHSQIRFNKAEPSPFPLATVYLPTDYSPDRKYPLIVFVNGADGISGESAAFPRQFFGDQGFICVGLPSFKKSVEPLKDDQSNYWPRMIIRTADGPHIWSAYRPIFARILAEIPNIDRSRTVFGGFSNGAHTATALLSSPETAPEFLSLFQTFVLIEGGHKLTPPTIPPASATPATLASASPATPTTIPTPLATTPSSASPTTAPSPLTTSPASASAAPSLSLKGTRFFLLRGANRAEDIFPQTKSALTASGATWSEHLMPNVEHDISPDTYPTVRTWTISQFQSPTTNPTTPFPHP